MGIEDRLERTTDRVDDTEREIERLKDRVQSLESALLHIAKERHDVAVESRGFMRGHNVDFEVCAEIACATVRNE